VPRSASVAKDVKVNGVIIASSNVISYSPERPIIKLFSPQINAVPSKFYIALRLTAGSFFSLLLIPYVTVTLRHGKPSVKSKDFKYSLTSASLLPINLF
jgi:hypothetical protein